MHSVLMWKKCELQRKKHEQVIIIAILQNYCDLWNKATIRNLKTKLSAFTIINQYNINTLLYITCYTEDLGILQM
jgi:hypothetical protein